MVKIFRMKDITIRIEARDGAGNTHVRSATLTEEDGRRALEAERLRKEAAAQPDEPIDLLRDEDKALLEEAEAKLRAEE